MKLIPKLGALLFRFMMFISCATIVVDAFNSMVSGSGSIGDFFIALVVAVLMYKLIAPIGARLVAWGLKENLAPPSKHKRRSNPLTDLFTGRIVHNFSQDIGNSLMEFLMSTVTPSASDYVPSSNEANDRAWRQYQARNNAIFHENQAKKYAGTYDGYRHANQAKQAWSDSKK